MGNRFDKVNIVGAGVNFEAYKDYKNYTIGINNIHQKAAINMLFHMHDINKKVHRKHIEKAKEMNLEIITFKNYPLKAILKKFPIKNFISSIDYILAYLLYYGVNEINMFGVHLIHKTEYFTQRPGAYLWIGYLLGKGVKINIHSPFIEIDKEILYPLHK